MHDGFSGPDDKAGTLDLGGLADLLEGWSAAGFAAKRRFEAAARRYIRLPQPGEGPLDYLLPEVVWQELLNRVPDPEGWLMALSAATGVYFFPSREWPVKFMRFLGLLRVRRLLEAGAGRGYLTAALAPLTETAGIDFKAVDKGEGDFQVPLPVHHRVESGDVFQVVHEFQPEVVVYAWPPPGQSLAPLLQMPCLRSLIVIGERGGGAVGAREDWQNLAHRFSPVLSCWGRGRTGPDRHQVTIFLRQ
ncbi:MAG: hypothetical protein JRI59_06975 [Deltaproteobacteria bacterium]|nr:hypothetical protein [Deltaproteobacteria bacterium]